MREKLIELLDGIQSHGWRRIETDHSITLAVVENKAIAEHLLANGVTIQKWIPVTERLPDNNGKYLVARKEGGRYSISVRKFRKEVPCWYTGYCGHWERRTNGITHWMPLPEPPKEGWRE